jgi:hypothetical protein
MVPRCIGKALNGPSRRYPAWAGGLKTDDAGDLLLRGEDDAAISFAKCDASEPRQQWCFTAIGEIRDVWGRCLSRKTCDNPGGVGSMLVSACGTQCEGSQHWSFDSGVVGNRIVSGINKQCEGKSTGGGCACLDISVLSNACNTYPCKAHDSSKGPGYCGDANQHWALNADGTLAVQIQPTAMCAAAKGFGWGWCSDKTKPMVDSNPCPPACLVAAEPPSSARPETASGTKGRTCVNRSGGWGGVLAGLLIVVGACYAVGGMLVNLKASGMPPPREIGRLLPHRPFWSAVRGLVNDGIDLTGRRLTGRSGGGSGGQLPRGDSSDVSGLVGQQKQDSIRSPKRMAAKDHDRQPSAGKSKEGKSRGGKSAKKKVTVERAARDGGDGGGDKEEPLLVNETEREKEMRLGRQVSEHVDAFGRTLLR